MSKTAARWLGCAAIALLLIAGGRQDAEASLVVDMERQLNGDVLATVVGNWVAYSDPGFFPSFDPSNKIASTGGGTAWSLSRSTVAGVNSDRDILTAPSHNTGMTVTRLGDNPSPAPAGLLGYNISHGGVGSANFAAVINVDPTTPLVVNDTFTFASAAIVSFVPGSVTFSSTAGPDTLTFNYSVVVPEPTTALGLLGLVTSAFFRRRRRLLG